MFRGGGLGDPNRQINVGPEPNKCVPWDKKTWSLAGSKLLENEGYVTFSISTGRTFMPEAAAPFLLPNQVRGALVGSGARDPRTTTNLKNLQLGAFTGPQALTDVMCVALNAICESRAMEVDGEGVPRGCGYERNQDVVSAGESRYTFSGERINIYQLLAVEDPTNTPFNYLALGYLPGRGKAALVSSGSIAPDGWVRDVGLPQLPPIAIEDCSKQILACAELVTAPGLINDSNAFSSIRMATLWRGQRNELPFRPDFKRGRRAEERKGEDPAAARRPKTNAAVIAAAAAKAERGKSESGGGGGGGKGGCCAGLKSSRPQRTSIQRRPPPKAHLLPVDRGEPGHACPARKAGGRAAGERREVGL